jgi:hypothetical protein
MHSIAHNVIPSLYRSAWKSLTRFLASPLGKHLGRVYHQLSIRVESSLVLSTTFVQAEVDGKDCERGKAGASHAAATSDVIHAYNDKLVNTNSHTLKEPF